VEAGVPAEAVPHTFDFDARERLVRLQPAGKANRTAPRTAAGVADAWPTRSRRVADA
jgi:hypothetical protein